MAYASSETPLSSTGKQLELPLPGGPAHRGPPSMLWAGRGQGPQQSCQPSSPQAGCWLSHRLLRAQRNSPNPSRVHSDGGEPLPGSRQALI